MSEQERQPHESLVKCIENLASALQNSSVGEMEIASFGTKITIKRQTERTAIVSYSPQQIRTPRATITSSPGSRVEEDRSIAIVAPLTGVFYLSPSPDSPPFVKIGDVIQLDQVVGLIEAMKVFNEIQANKTGRLTTISAKHGSLVKKGDTLFRIDPL